MIILSLHLVLSRAELSWWCGTPAGVYNLEVCLDVAPFDLVRNMRGGDDDDDNLCPTSMLLTEMAQVAHHRRHRWEDRSGLRVVRD